MEELEFKEIKRLLNVCYQCGTCVSSCAAGLVNAERNIRKLVRNLIDAEDEFAIKKNDLLWLCTTCYQCEDRCPEGIPLTSLLIQLKTWLLTEVWFQPLSGRRLKRLQPIILRIRR